MGHMKWGMIGCGSVTERKSAPAYSVVEDFSLKGVFGRNRSKAADYARRHNVALVFDSVMELVHSDEIDAVYIATPPDSHEELALAVAEARKPCCIEKPMAPRSQRVRTHP
ncbi:Gfo/Idh/MocA family oxidoreductase [Altererythrobacter sp. BO-6]|uniref:Gfo/Idh/MocA family protein n=1 Tax=Altererythrobacter sp. BO-6 TaxID=2604537 RepID=UPI0019D0FE7B|nr:Gfo/Idh/MocA family oxidoreductase [Altererythrobacter sp. BO-6]